MIRTLSDMASSGGEGTDVASPVPPLTLADLARTRTRDTMLIEGLDDVFATPALRRRLLETGFTAGCPVRFVVATPFGDPLVFSLRGTSIALRRDEACCVRVRAERAP